MRNSLGEGVPYVLEADRLGSLALEGEIIKGSDESQSQLLNGNNNNFLLNWLLGGSKK